ncbi:heparinase II/III domain-containing protein [Vreelandella janggokensis]|uniref:Heparinase II/III-family protein n=1 Tax=Vreelandella janggokensis TaxID=370767 RepID=A0ABT4IQ00_9GAMM|nr:heparinase II/III family protein [Halomonas janggokensis]MCZ0925754.1 heparinase II/III-family protein [Halomonas janggokensis]
MIDSIKKIFSTLFNDDQTYKLPSFRRIVSEGDCYKYERITNISSRQWKKNADRILAKGWHSSDGDCYHVGTSEVDWADDIKRLRSVSVALHSWNPIDVLLTAYSESGLLKYLKPCISYSLSWVESHLDKQSVSVFSWYDMAAGLRSYRLAFIIESGLKEKLLSRDEGNHLWASFIEHIRYLSDDDKISFHNNHGYFQIAGLLLSSRRFLYLGSIFGDAYNRSILNLEKLMLNQFTLEGIHKEHSPEYHYLIYCNLRRLLDACEVKSDLIEGLISEAEDNLFWFVYPDSKLVNLGDSPSRSLILPSDEVKNRWRGDPMRFVSSDGLIGSCVGFGSKAFYDSGYWVVKSKNTHKNFLENYRYSHLVFNCAFHSRTHKHADDLSFVLHEMGVPVFVDSGRFGYVGKVDSSSELWKEGFWYSNPKRIYCESTKAHNTLEFDSRSFDRVHKNPYGSALKLDGFSDGVYYASASCNPLNSIFYNRVILYKPGEWIWLVDNFSDSQCLKHSVKQYFNLDSKHVAYKMSNRSIEVAIKDDTENLISNANIFCLGSNKIDTNIVSGQFEPFLDGWQSPSDNEFLPATSFYFENKDSVGWFATLCSFTKELKVDEVKSYVDDNSGCFYLFWCDGLFSHELKSNNHVDQLDFSYITKRV